MASYSNRDISLIPDISFSFVESYIRTCRDSSGDKSINKGFKYYSEGFVHDLKGMFLFCYIVPLTLLFYYYNIPQGTLTSSHS